MKLDYLKKLWNMKEIEWLRPREVAKRGLIKSPGPAQTVEGHYRFIMRQINSGQLAAVDYSTTPYRAYWLVPTDAIKEYNKRRTKVDA